MFKLSGTAADDRLAEAWNAVFRADPATQTIIHILAPPTEYQAWLTGFPPFEAWLRNGCSASERVWRALAEVGVGWPYIRNACRALALGIPNVRVFVTERAQWQSPPRGCDTSLRCTCPQLRHWLARRFSGCGAKIAAIPASKTATTTSNFGVRAA